MELLRISLGAPTNLTWSFLRPPRELLRAIRTLIQPNPIEIKPNPSNIESKSNQNRIRIQIQIQIQNQSKILVDNSKILVHITRILARNPSRILVMLKNPGRILVDSFLLRSSYLAVLWAPTAPREGLDGDGAPVAPELGGSAGLPPVAPRAGGLGTTEVLGSIFL